MRKRTIAREFALQILYQQEINPDDLKQTLEGFWRQQISVAPEVREFAEKTVRGTLEKLAEIDQIIRKYADNWDLHRMAAVDRNVMRLAVYELIFRDDIPPKVAINEAVNLAKKFSQNDSGKFVNGVLDKISHTEKQSASPSS